MLSNKSYLIRAFYDWIVDSQCTPLFAVDATYPRCIVPQEFIENGEIVLNAAPGAIRDFKISIDLVEFRASFSGVVHIISAPIKAILAIYAEENGEGMFFDYEEEDNAALTNDSVGIVTKKEVASNDGQKKQKASYLKLVE